MAVADTTKVIKIDVDARDAKKAIQAMTNHFDVMKKSALGITETMWRVQMGIAAVANFFFVERLAQLADTFTILNSRLKLVTKSTAELMAVNKDLLSSANSVYASYADFAKLYTDLKFKTDGLNLSHDKAIKLAKALSNSFRISGASAKEASSAVMQLMQGLSSGTLAGDELKTLRETNSVLMKAIAEEAKQTFDLTKANIGTVKELGAKGLLTAELVSRAILKQADSLEKQAKVLDKTFADIFNVAENNLVSFVGVLETSGNLNGIKNLFDDLAKSIDSVAISLGSMVAAFGALKIGSILVNLRGVLSVLTAIAKSPVFAIAASIGAVAGYFSELNKQINSASKTDLSFFEVLAKVPEAFSKLSPEGDFFFAVTDSVKAFRDGLAEVFSFVGKIASGLTRIGEFFLRLGEMAIFMITTFSKKIYDVFTFVRSAAMNPMISMKDMIKAIPDILTPTDKEMQSYDYILNRLDDLIKGKTSPGKEFGGFILSGLDSLKNTMNEVWNKARDIAKLSKEKEGLAAVVEQMQSNFGFFAKSTEESNESISVLSSSTKQVGSDAIDFMINPIIAGFSQMHEKVYNLIHQQKTWQNSIVNGIKLYSDSISDFYKTIQNATTKTFKSIEDSIVDMVMTGKLEVKDLVNTMISEFARIQVQKNVMPVLVELGASIFGGAVAPAAATNAGQVSYMDYLSSEYNSGAGFTPTEVSAFKSVSRVQTPVSMMPASTNVTVINNSKSEVKTEESTGANGEKQLRFYIEDVVKQSIVSGSMDSALQSVSSSFRRGGTR